MGGHRPQAWLPVRRSVTSPARSDFSVLSLASFPIGTLIGALGIWLFGFEPTV
jgi:hypothetical protein